MIVDVTIAAVIAAAAIGGSIVGMVKLLDVRAQGLVASALALVEPLRDEIAVLKREVSSLRDRVYHLESENHTLWKWGRLNYGRLIELGEEPEPIPAPISKKGKL